MRPKHVLLALAALTFNAAAAVLYVDLNSTNATPPYSDWTTAATNIQDAVDTAVDGDQVLVADGVYRYGGATAANDSNRVAVTKAITLQSVSGPEVTMIQGDAVNYARCVYLTNNAVLLGFTLTNGATLVGGAGVWCESASAVVSNCVIINNCRGGARGGTLNNCLLSGNRAGQGGGASYSTLINCTLTGNSASEHGSRWGGGAWSCVLDNCVLSNNSGSYGGGVHSSTLTNCALTGNWAINGGGAYNSELNNCIANSNSASGSGGGAYGGTLTNCALIGNSAGDGGGANDSALNNCTVNSNSASNHGGGANGGTLTDCTLTDNSADSGGGAYFGILNNCTLSNNAATSYGGGAYGGTLNNCALSANSADAGGGACGGTLTNCTLTGNSATFGGGAYGGTLNNCALSANSADAGGGADGGTLKGCTLTGNSADVGGGINDSTLNDCLLVGNSSAEGGGANYSTLTNCTLTGNAAANGGGACNSTLNCCTLSGNSASHVGGGALSGALNNCLLYSNSAACGGGTFGGTLTNCTLAGNSAGSSVGGACGSWLYNCIACYNTAPANANYDDTILNYCCTTPLPEFGTGNITNEPLFVNLSAGNLHLRFGSPCINAGDNSYVVTNSTDLDGKARVVNGTVDMGAYEFQTHFVNLNSTNPTPPYVYWSTAATNIQDAVDAALDGEQVLVTNGIYQTGGRTASGSLTNRVAVVKALSVQSVNGPGATVIRGYWVPGVTNGPSAVRCVYLTNGAVLAGFTLTGGATRASGTPPDDRQGGGVFCASPTVVVSNCVLAGNAAGDSGGGACSGTLYDCILRTNSAFVGGGAVNSALSNCLVVANFAGYGGGVDGCTLNHCTVTRNIAVGGLGGAGISSGTGGGAENSAIINSMITSNHAGIGGGIYCSPNITNTLNNCALVGNAAIYEGGAAYRGVLNNCTLMGNSVLAGPGGGASYATLNNCVIYYNTGSSYPDCRNTVTLSHCCTPLIPDFLGGGYFSSAPLFVNMAAGNLRLQTNSPCINAGDNSCVTNSTDLDGRPRIVNGTVDIGAYEFQGAGMGEFIGWLQSCSLSTDGSADFADADGDQLNNWQEWLLGTNPTNITTTADSLQMLSLSNSASGLTLAWRSAAGLTYFLQRSTNLAAHPAFVTIQTNIIGQANTTSYTDTDATGPGPYFYRVGVDTGCSQALAPFSAISFAWLQQYGLPTDGSMDYVDTDHDCLNNWQEWRAQTDPTNDLCVLRMLMPTNSVSGLIVSWESVSGVTYYLQRATYATGQAVFSSIQSNIVGQAGVTSCTDTNIPGPGPFYYRVGVQ